MDRFEVHDISNLDPPASVMFEPCLVLLFVIDCEICTAGISKSETIFCLKCCNVAPIGSMYDIIFVCNTNIWCIFIGIYTIHGSYGSVYLICLGYDRTRNLNT